MHRKYQSTGAFATKFTLWISVSMVDGCFNNDKV